MMATRAKRPYVAMTRRSRGIRCLELSECGSLYHRILPHQKLILMVILLALKDRATELRFEPRESETDDFGLTLSYKVGGVWYDLVPPPDMVAPFITIELERLSGLATIKQTLEKAFRRLLTRIHVGRVKSRKVSFQIRGDNHLINVTAISVPSDAYNCITLSFCDIPVAIAAQALRLLRERVRQSHPDECEGL